MNNSKKYREELLKIMPGYSWTVHQSNSERRLDATGTQSSGFNRLSTLSVVRTEEEDGSVYYEAKSAGFGLQAKYLLSNTDRTLARALRGLQNSYEAHARTYLGHANALENGRIERQEVGGNG